MRLVAVVSSRVSPEARWVRMNCCTTMRPSPFVTFVDAASPLRSRHRGRAGGDAVAHGPRAGMAVEAGALRRAVRAGRQLGDRRPVGGGGAHEGARPERLR